MWISWPFSHTQCIMQHTARAPLPPCLAATTHQQSETKPPKPANLPLLSLPQHYLATDHMRNTRFWETGTGKENSDLLCATRDGTPFQFHNCKCANERLEHFIHWHFIHLTPAAWEVHQCQHIQCSFHSCNVKPGCTRNIQNIHVFSLLLHWASENFCVHFPIHIHLIPFSMQMAQSPSWSNSRFKTFPCLSDSCYKAEFPNASNNLLVSIPSAELEGSSLCPGEPELPQNSKSRGLAMQNHRS